MSQILLVLMLSGCLFSIAASQNSHQIIATHNQTVLNIAACKFEPYLVENRNNALSDGINFLFIEAIASKFHLTINYVKLQK